MNLDIHQDTVRLGSADAGGVIIEFSLHEFLESLNEQQTDAVVEAVTWGRVLDQAVARLTGESEVFESPTDARLSMRVIQAIEERAFGYGAWAPLEQALQGARDAIIADYIHPDGDYHMRSARIDVAYDAARDIGQRLRTAVARGIRSARKAAREREEVRDVG